MEMIKSKYYYAEFSTDCGGIYDVEYPKDFIDEMARDQEESVKRVLLRVSSDAFGAIEEGAEMHFPKIEEIILIEELILALPSKSLFCVPKDLTIKHISPVGSWVK